MRKLKRFIPPIVVADEHDFVGRIFDLAMPLTLGFKSNKQLARYPDAHYVMQIYWRLSFLIQRAESLNMVRKMLLGRRLPKSFKDFPVNRYEWLTISADVFLMRYVSVSDCCLHLVNEVYEAGLNPRACNADNLRKKGVSKAVLDALAKIAGKTSSHRKERNWRVHESLERNFTRHDAAFQAMSVFESYGGEPLPFPDRGRTSDITKWFDRAVTRLRKETSDASVGLAGALPALYGELAGEFEARFKKKKATSKTVPWMRTPRANSRGKASTPKRQSPPK